MADLSARRILPHQLRKCGLQFGIAPHQRIVFLIGYLRRVLGMVKSIMMRNLLGQPHQLVCGIGLGEVWRHQKTYSS